MRGCFVAFLWLLFLRAKLGQASVVPEATPEEVAIVEYAKNNGAHVGLLQFLRKHKGWQRS